MAWERLLSAASAPIPGLLLLLALAVPCLLSPEAARAASGPVAVTECGLYGMERSREGTFRPELENAARLVPGKRGTTFGFRFKGASSDDPGEYTAVLTHPELVDPVTGERSTEEHWAVRLDESGRGFAGYTLSHDWEIRPGDWVLSIHLDGEAVAWRTFTVIPPKSQRGARNLMVSLKPIKTPGEGAKPVKKDAPKAKAAESGPAEKEEPDSGKEVLVVQVAAFPEHAEARAVTRLIRKKGLAPSILAVPGPSKEAFYAVVLGPFDGLDQARRAADGYRAAFNKNSRINRMPEGDFRRARR